MIALIVIGWVWFASGRKSSPIARIPPIEGERSRSALGATQDVVLPGNVNLQIPRGGMEDRLLNFIQNRAETAANRDNWFDLEPQSQQQLSDVAAILKAHPNVRVAIGGYTDQAGQANAENVIKQLTAMGVNPDRMQTDGSAGGGHQTNGLSLRVTQK